ncbi:hypothetical protein [Pyxidicoccus xibeiensis]|uniref:hypothetical protein n=1 Tax=Pyxidicoccus xibeiensis TaxID=2906759 RepID=UPI0020A78107|nr:hypothetical protein [Pyxidicoccus xibeiensis]MCP3136828.1 hypothetical protein [Pyxidicoccus xibeiensis]
MESCKLCQAPMSPEDIQWDLAMARCPECRAVYDVSGHKAEPLAAPAPALPSQPRAPVPLPSRFQVEEVDGTLRLRWRWVSVHVFSEFIFAAILDAMVALTVVTYISGDTKLGELLCLSPFAVLAVLLTYRVMMLLLNHTTLEVSRHQLSIRHGPIPGRRDLELKGSQLTQLYGRECVHKGNVGDTLTYDLIARDDKGREVTLLAGLEEVQQVLFLEQQLERRLGIEDTPVEGEVASRPPAA